MAITDEVLNELMKDYQKPEDLLGKDGLLRQLQKRLLEKALGAVWRTCRALANRQRLRIFQRRTNCLGNRWPAETPLRLLLRPCHLRTRPAPFPTLC